MDNLVEYLVIIFFIVSALSSLFKKNPRADTGQNTDKVPESDKSFNLGKILFPDEIYGNEKPQPRKSEQYQYDLNYKSSPRDLYEESNDVYNEHVKYKPQKLSEVDSYFEEAIKRSTLSGRVKTPAQPATSTRTKQAVDKSMELMQNTPILSTDAKVSRRLNDIKLKLGEMGELRELILINEILSKPKALRRR